MPRHARSPEAIETVRRQILDAAVEIIYTDGFNNLSMRRIGGKTGMTAANIYNYFSGKDEIYLAIQTRGFAKLGDRFARIEAEPGAPAEKIRRMIRAYIDFGTAHPDQYEIMFTRNTPKYVDYIGTPMEPAARVEKETALQVAALAETAVSRVLQEEDSAFRTVALWTALHGLVSLVNSRVLQEVNPDTAGIIASVEEELMARFNSHGTTEKEGFHAAGTGS